MEITTKAIERRLAYIFGASAVIILLVFALAVPCPTIFQQRIVQVVISLATAGIAAMIPGFINVTVSNYVRAGGALAAFVLVFLSNPASWTDGSTDGNASCKDMPPVGFLQIPIISISELPPKLNPRTNPPITSNLAQGRPTKFTFNYQFEPQPGRRDWAQIRSGVWIEMYPDGQGVTVHSEELRSSLDGCAGTVVTPNKGAFEVFIPDFGCANMWLRFRHNGGTWQWLAEMLDVS